MGPLTYWLRLEDVLADPQIDDRLIDHAHRGLRLLQADEDLDGWTAEARLLLRMVDDHLQVAGASAPDLIAVCQAAPAVESLRSVLQTVTDGRSPALAGFTAAPVVV